jgi:hypothetical protein
VTHGARCFSAVLRRPKRSPLLWLAALFIIFVSTLLCPQPGLTQDTQNGNSLPGSLRGTVINSVTHEPLAHALVASFDNRFAMFTDDQGRFEFQLPRIESNSNISASGGLAGRNGIYSSSIQCMARKPGFIESGSGVFSQFRNGVWDDMTIALTPESLIVGRVNLPSSNQSDRITVEVYKRQVRDGRPYWVSTANTLTRSSGEFRIANLAAGTYKIFTDELMDRDPISFDPAGQLYGYPPIYYPAATDFASASAITLEAGKTLQVEVSPVLQPYYQVKIAVTNIDAESELTVSVARQGHKGPGYSLGYPGGSSIEGMLPSGTYTVEAAVQQVPPTADGIVNITLKDAPVTHASMAVLPCGPIPVNIKDDRSEKGPQFFGEVKYGRASRRAIADVNLTPADDFEWMGVSLRQPRKPNDDELVLDNVRPGRYWLNVMPYFGYVASAFAGSVDLLRQPLVVGLGSASLPIEISVRDDGATIEGTVEGMPAAPFSQRMLSPGLSGNPLFAYVYCIPLPDSSGRFMEAGISVEGTFQFKQLPPGAYRVLAFDHQQSDLEYRNAEAMSVYESKGPVVRLGTGQTEQVRVTLISNKE